MKGCRLRLWTGRCSSGAACSRTSRAEAAGLRRNSGDQAVAYLDYAGDPVRGFTSFRLQSWQPLSRTQLVLWNGVNEAYLVTVWDGCSDLQFAQSLPDQRDPAR
jgi:hypothetical protein